MWLALSLGLMAMAAAVSAQAQTLTVLHSFTGSDGANPSSALIRDAAANLYGTTSSGGASSNCKQGCGTVFELVYSSGSYTGKVLYSFTGQANGDGAGPGTGLVMDTAGNLYGTTSLGGASGFGTVFELVDSSGSYTEKVLYSFSLEGGWPPGGLIIDTAGNLYGTTLIGGSGGAGTVFELVKSSGNYTEQELYSFTFLNGDGLGPNPGVVMDPAGDIYGTTAAGGNSSACDSGCGIVFELVYSFGNYATGRLLYSFSGSGGDGAGPSAGLIMDAAGNLYGTTAEGGAYGYGTAFELVKSSGDYSEKVLYSFTFPGSYGIGPAGPIMDNAGNFYGTIGLGGASGWGTLFELVNSSGNYTEKVLHNFGGFSGDGEQPQARLVMDASGNFYGTTAGGGTNLYGTAFVLNPTATAPEVELARGLSFGDQTLGTTSPVQALTATNSGNAELTFGAAAVTLSGPDATDFVLNADTCGGITLTPGGTCSVSAAFTPSAFGSADATINFEDNAPNSPQTVSLHGRGVSLGVASFSPSSLAFNGQLVGTHSAPQTITLSNTGTGPLGFASVATDSSDFSAASNCPASLAVGASCSISVTFTPGIAGEDGSFLWVTDDASGSPQGVALAGIGVAPADFSLGVAPLSPSSATVTAGNTANYSLSVAPQGGFNQPVSLTCAGAPLLATCMLSPASVTLDGTNSVTVKVTVSTTAPTIVPPLAPPDPNAWPALLLAMLALLAFAALPKVATRITADARSARLALIGLVAALLLGVMLSPSCGGGGSSSPGPGSPGTPAGSYTLTVMATSGNLAHSTSLTLTVQ